MLLHLFWVNLSCKALVKCLKITKRGVDLIKKGVTIVVLPIKTVLSGRPNSPCFYLSLALGNEAGEKGPGALIHLIIWCTKSNCLWSAISNTSIPLRNFQTSNAVRTKLGSQSVSSWLVLPGTELCGPLSAWAVPLQLVWYLLRASCALWISLNISLAAYGSQIIPYVLIWPSQLGEKLLEEQNPPSLPPFHIWNTLIRHYPWHWWTRQTASALRQCSV